MQKMKEKRKKTYQVKGRGEERRGEERRGEERRGEERRGRRTGNSSFDVRLPAGTTSLEKWL
jgi:hypothetical protein